jgi:hypothetical protein
MVRKKGAMLPALAGLEALTGQRLPICPFIVRRAIFVCVSVRDCHFKWVAG